MKKLILFFSLIFFNSFFFYSQTPGDHCADPPILNVDTEYTITNLDINQYTYGAPIDGHSYGGNDVRGFWLRVRIPSGYYAREIRIYDVSSNFDPVIGLKSHCTYSYYPNTLSNNNFADENGYGGNEVFGTGLTGPDSNNDGIYHIRIYHYRGDETPRVSFKIKITDGNSSSNYDLYITDQEVDNTIPHIGDRIRLSCRQNFSGSCGCSRLDPNPKVGFYLSTNRTFEASADQLLGSEPSTIGDDDDSDPEHIYWTVPSNVSPGNYYILFVADYDNQHVESNEHNNTEYVPITVEASSCTGVSITRQPRNQTVSEGNTATFSVTATGSSPITYQWRKNGVDINGANSPTYTTPPVSMADNGNRYSCFLENCNGHFQVTSNTAILNVETVMPSTILVENIISGNTAFSNPKTLWQGTTNDTDALIKICADGSEVTRFTFVNNSNIPTNHIKFRFASDPDGTDTAQYGSFNISYTSNIVTVWLTHPAFFNSNDVFRNDVIQIYDDANNSIIYSIPVRIYKAPVLMVHGLWGNGDTFESLENYLDSLLYPHVLTYRSDYYFSHSASFYNNRFIVPNDINTLLRLARNHKFSAGKVDVIGHSMGGLLARLYIQSYAYSIKQNIHKLITVNTPHSGSQWGNLLTDNYRAKIIGELIFNYHHYSWIYNDTLNEAVRDLAVGSQAMNYLNNTTLNSNVVPSHTITTVGVKNLKPWNTIISLILPTYYNLGILTIDGFLNYLFYNDNNDMVVALASQKGGLSGHATSLFTNQVHAGSPDNTYIQRMIRLLLKANPNSSYFQYGFSPATIQSHYREARFSSSMTNSYDGSIEITNPVSQQTFNAGDMLNVNIASHNNIDKILLSVVSHYSDSSEVWEFNTANASFRYNIPDDAYGKVLLIAVGYAQNSFIDYDTITVNINSQLTLDSISVPLDTLLIADNYVAALPVKAYLSNGDSYYLYNDPQLQFHVNDTSIAEHYYANTFKGNSVGNTTLHLTYQRFERDIPVVVYEGDDMISELPDTASTATKKVKYGEINDLMIYPNSNHGKFIIQFKARINSSVYIKIFDNNGKAIYLFNEKNNRTVYRKSITLKNVAKGIYYIKIKNEDKESIRKIIIMP